MCDSAIASPGNFPIVGCGNESHLTSAENPRTPTFFGSTLNSAA